MNLDKLLSFFWTRKVDEIEDVPRGFARSIDATPNYCVWLDDEHGYSVSLECVCGLHLALPDSVTGIYDVHHDKECCGYKARIRLVNYREWERKKTPQN